MKLIGPNVQIIGLPKEGESIRGVFAELTL